MYDWIGRITKLIERKPSLAGWVGVVPRPVMFGAASLCGWLLWKKERQLRAKVLANMRDLLPSRSDTELNAACRDYFRNFLIVLYEIILDSGRLHLSEHWRFRVEGERYLQEALEEGKGAVVFAPHVGNFFYYYWYLSRRYSCLTVVTAGSPELRPLYLLFQRMGCRGLDYDATPPIELMRTLRKHLRQNGVVFLLGDFWRPIFPKAKLFDRITRSPSGTTALALEQQVPVVPFYGYREQGFRHRLVFGPVIHLHEEFRPDQRKEATSRLNRLIEEAVRSVPSQWLYWFNAESRWEDDLAVRRQPEQGKASWSIGNPLV
ncbi:MAG: lysophospholipid acyltransferase family protein [Brevibacillus sp.]|nr:lysophospholipid acyltransferase family protein [Brevibacillus sp.]